MGPQRVRHDWATKHSLLNGPDLVTVDGIQPQFFSVPFVDCWSECQMGNMHLVTCLPSKHKWLRTQQRYQCICRRNLWRLLVFIFHASLPTHHVPPGTSPKHHLVSQNLSLSSHSALITNNYFHLSEVKIMSILQIESKMLSSASSPAPWKAVDLYLSTFAGITKVCHTRK